MTITVYYATNRNETGTEDKPSFGPNFHAKGLSYLRFGDAEVEAPRRGQKEYKVASVRLERENMDPGPGKPPVFGSRAIFEGLRSRMKAEQTDMLLLIHGFAADFRTVLERGAQLKDVYAQAGRKLEVAVFSWPADGETIPAYSYANDREDAQASGHAIARALLKVLDYFGDLKREQYCWRDLHLVAHSMGNFALRHALQSLLTEIGGKPLPRIFKNIFLMAADEDNDAFEHVHKLARLPELAEFVHVYYSATDRALDISELTKGNPDRLGDTGPRTLSDLPHKVNLIDCTDVDDTGSVSDAQHQYYRLRPEVIADVRQVLAGTPADLIKNRTYVPAKRSYRVKAARK